MNGRAPFLRVLALALATLQVVSPALVVFADGSSMRNAVAESVSHVEGTSSDSCSQVHAPDCGLCRYLSGLTALLPQVHMAVTAPDPASAAPGSLRLHISSVRFFPPGRAPPVA